MVDRNKFHPSDDVLVAAVHAYTVDELSLKVIAQRQEVGPAIVRRWLCSMGVPIRSKHEQRKRDRTHGREDQAAAIRAARGRGCDDTEAVRAQASTIAHRSKEGTKNPLTGKHHSPQTKARLSEAARYRSIPGLGHYTEDWTESLRESIIRRDGAKCLVCGTCDGTLQVHHVDLVRSSNALTNLLTLCATCHLGYHGRAENVDAIHDAHVALLRRLFAAEREATR